MIKFFRRIRKRLLTENKFSKYLLYAIGEIVLVIIGILVALSVNNKNELRKEKVEEEKILVGIKNDFIETRKRLIRTMYQQEKTAHYSQRLINLLESKESLLNSDSISRYLTFGATSYWRAEPVIGTYDALIGSGNTSIIQNQELLTSLAKFSAISKLPFEDEANSMNLLSLMHESIANYHYILKADDNRRSIGATGRYTEEEKQTAIKKLMNNKAFLSYLLSRTGAEDNRLERHKSLLESTKDILNTFGVKDILLSTEELQKYVGHYQQIEGDKLKVEIIAKKNKLSAHFADIKAEIIPSNQDLYYFPNAGDILFEVENNNAIGFTFVDEDNNQELKFKRVQQ